MKRPLIITIGIFIILCIIGLWVYLLLYGPPEEARDVFANLGVVPKDTQEVRTLEGNVPLQPDALLGLNGTKLEQLTLRAIAGFGFSSTTADLIRYVERGTGHIYEMNLTDGTEVQISLTTVPQTVEAIFSPDASSVALTSYDGYEKLTSIGILTKGDTSMSLISLPRNSENISYKDAETVYFTISNSGTKGYAYDLPTLTQKILFDIELSDVSMVWGGELDALYVYPKPTMHLEGSLYMITNNMLVPVFDSSFGFSAFAHGGDLIATHIENDLFVSERLSGSVETPLAIAMVEEKCVADPRTQEGTWCAAPLQTDASYQEGWYKGTAISEDYLWYSDAAKQSATLIEDISRVAGRTLDIVDLTIHAQGDLLVFSNKTDQTLFVYRIGE